MNGSFHQPDTKPDPQILVLADDLTGALESGAAFAQRGIKSAVNLLKAHRTGEPVLVIDTETRHASEEQAAMRIGQLATSITARLIYKKTDSTLRGNIRAELQALSQRGPVLFVPAYPQMGRTVHDGCLYVHGIPVEQSPFAKDPVHPVRTGNIAALLADSSNINICHENTEAGIQAVARDWIEAGGIAAGPSSLLHAAAEVLAPGSLTPKFPNVSRALLVSGSRHVQSQRQIEAASQALRNWGWSVFCSPNEHRGDPLAFAAQFGEEAKRAFESDQFDTIIVFGGDTTFSLLNAMNIDSLEPIGEVLPGVPVSLLPSHKILITKAGGFGHPNLLFQVHERLTHERT
jgi:uncharacterized protein YgbK (DUF1537 family)